MKGARNFVREAHDEFWYERRNNSKTITKDDDDANREEMKTKKSSFVADIKRNSHEQHKRRASERETMKWENF